MLIFLRTLWISTTDQYYNRYFQKLDDGTFEEIKGGWFDVSFE